MASPCIGAERADLVLAGCAILEAIRRAFPCPRLACRRSWAARRHAGADDARGRRLGRRQPGCSVVTRAWQRQRPAPAKSSRPERQKSLAVVKTLAGASAQRSLRCAGEARGHALARRLQADGDRRQGALSEERRARGRPRRSAGRLEPGRGQACRRARSTVAWSRSTFWRWSRCRVSTSSGSDFLDRTRARKAQGNDRRSGRRGAVRHGGQRDRSRQAPTI